MSDPDIEIEEKIETDLTRGASKGGASVRTTHPHQKNTLVK